MYFHLFNVKEDPRVTRPNENHHPQDLPFGAALESQKEILNKVELFVSKMRVGKRRKMMPFQEAIVLSCKSLVSLYEMLRETFPDKNVEIQTYYLNQDVIEQLFALFRMFGVTNTNPSPVEIKHRFRHVLLGRNPEILLQGKNTNTLPDQTDASCQILSLQVQSLFFSLQELQKHNQKYIKFILFYKKNILCSDNSCCLICCYQKIIISQSCF